MGTMTSAKNDSMINKRTKRGIIKFLDRFGIVIIAILMFICFSFLIEGFASYKNVMSILEQISMFGIISIGVTFAIITKGIDLSSGSIVALSGVIAALILPYNEGVTITMIAFLGAILAGSLCGLLNGVFTAYGPIPPFVATLGMMTIARGGAQLLSNGRPIDASSSAFTYISDMSLAGIPGLVLVYGAAVLIGHMVLTRTKFGRHVFAIGGNDKAARICGINVERTLVWVYVYAGALAGLAGALNAARTYGGNPTAGVMWELDAIAATVIGGTSLSGGKGSVFLCVIGAFILGMMNKGLNVYGVDPYWQQIIKGCIIILAVLIDTLRRRRS